MEDLEKRFVDISIAPNTVKNILKNQKLANKLASLLDMGEISTADKTVGQLLYKLSTTIPPNLDHHSKILVDYIKDGKITSNDQLTAAYTSLDAMGESFDKDRFEKDCGVGVVITQEQIEETVTKLFETNKEEIASQGWDFNFSLLIKAAKDELKWAEGKSIVDTINKKCVDTLGEKPKKEKKKKGGKKEKPKAADESKKDDDDDLDLYKRKKISQLIGRDMKSAHNKPEILQKHMDVTGGKIFTRFPPEPNGYLHIGHAKAMRFSFTQASDNGGECYLRYDDTNPEKECKEYIDSIYNCVKWLGYDPYKVTYASDYFQELYDYAVDLIKKDCAYVCHQTAEEMQEGRRNMVESPYRNRTVDENLDLFEKMKQGRFEEGE